MESIEANKKIVRDFNLEVIQNGKFEFFQQIMHPEFVNHSAPENAQGAANMWDTFSKILRPAFPDLVVTIHEQISERELVTTRKTIEGTHLGNLFGISPTGKRIKINVIDIVRIKEGKYFEHWGINDFAQVINELKMENPQN